MIHHDLIMSITILLLNAVTILVFIFNVVFKIRCAVNAKSKPELDFYFKLIMKSIIGAFMAGISFYIGVRMWFKLEFMTLETVNNLRLIYAVLMLSMAFIISIIDRKYNPFQVK